MPAAFTRSLVVLSALSVGAVVTLPVAPARGQDTLQPDVANAKNAVLGEVNAAGVLVRSGPSEDYYATKRLNKGEQITIVGMTGDWLKVLPPPGAFCYVAKKYVDPTSGAVKGTDISVRAGSEIVTYKNTILTKVHEGDRLTILGEQDEYYRVQPPAGAYFYIAKRFVNPVRAIGPAPADVPAGGGSGGANISVGPGDGGNAGNIGGGAATRPVSRPPVARNPEVAPVRPSATQTARQIAAEKEYDEAEAAFVEASGQPVDQQPVEALTQRFTALAANESLPLTLRRNAQARAATLKARADIQKEMQEVARAREESNARLAKLKAEQEALQERIRGKQFFTAVGTLVTSEVQQGGQNLYRLADPATSRTVVYVKADDAVVQHVNNFVGLKGDVAMDAGLGIKVLTPTQVQQVDPAAVNQSVTATMLPPSMLPKVTPVDP